MISYPEDLMALKVRFENPIEKHRFTPDSIVYYPHQLLSHFKENTILKIEQNTYFYVWWKGESFEWENDPSINFSRIQAILNKILQPLKKSLSLKPFDPQKIKVETFNDGFYIFSLNPLKLVVQ
jgi:hypothetical protein